MAMTTHAPVQSVDEVRMEIRHALSDLVRAHSDGDARRALRAERRIHALLDRL